MKSVNNKLIGFFGNSWVSFAMIFLCILSAICLKYNNYYNYTFFDKVVLVLVLVSIYTKLVVYIRKKKAQRLIKNFKKGEVK